MSTQNSKFTALILSSLLILSSTYIMAQPIPTATYAINIGFSVGPSSFNPIRARGIWNHEIIRNIFEGLISINSQGEIIPAQADSWEVSDDGTIWTFKLRRNAYWSDGEAVTAAQFVRAWQLALNAPGDRQDYQLPEIKNSSAIIAGELSIQALGIRALNGHSLEIILEQKNPIFLEMLFAYTLVPIPLHLSNILDFSQRWLTIKNSVFNGAYVLSNVELGDDADELMKITLVANSSYYNNSSTLIRKINFTAYAGNNRLMVQDFRAGKLHIAYLGLSSSQSSFILENFKGPLTQESYYGINYLLINHQISELEKAEIREAISMSIDRVEIINKILGHNAVPAYSILPPDDISGANMLKPHWHELTQEQRIAHARSTLEAAGYSSQKPLVLEVSMRRNITHERIITAIHSMLTRIHIDVKIIPTSSPIYFRSLSSGNFQAGRLGWKGAFNIPQTFTQIFHSNSTYNYANWNDPTYDRLFVDFGRSSDSEARKRLLNRMLQRIMDETVIIPLFYDTSITLIDEKVTGYHKNPYEAHLYRWLELH
ncbi:MAG: hypothetical protein COC19_05945 [SAR86 cluster bacterium]|uniref:Solute-binding protein family 5 domain-containing protein n=1 Tax=SAR86 cluster bacterium TaxID=2030880 RepID=A0A2A4ML38_9GAMM|nr:MAG: hypothetical protein COC19_05945 [SAR86 cluster bacterium]